MDKFLVRGGSRLAGDVRCSGAKNATLPILFSTLLAEGEHTFENVPVLQDILFTQEILRHLGAESVRVDNQLRVMVAAQSTGTAPYDLVRKMRASILCLGPLLARHGYAKVSLPGGCAIGSRPINLHLEALKLMGAKITLDEGYVVGQCDRLQGANILFDAPTVGGTENVLMAATLADGITVIENAAKEPEIVDLANYLNRMGARIEGAGTGIIRIVGVNKLKPGQHRIIPDRIEAGTLAIAGAITHGRVRVTDCRPQDLDALIGKLREANVIVETGEDWIQVDSGGELKAVDISTMPHPGFPTDLQAQFMALMSIAQGTSVINENIFENRFMHVQELVRLGADITPKLRVAIVRGKQQGLKAAPVMATDLRASACLVLAALVAQGTTQIQRIYHLDRGYENLEHKLNSLGANVERV